MFSVLITPIHFDFGKGGQDVLEKALIPKAFGVVHKTPAALRKKPASTVSQWMPVGGVGGIRTRVPLITATRFPVVLVMTSSIPLQIGESRRAVGPDRDSDMYYTRFLIVSQEQDRDFYKITGTWPKVRKKTKTDR